MTEESTQENKTTLSLKNFDGADLLSSLKIEDPSEPVVPKCKVCNDVGVVWVQCADGIKRRFSCSCQDNQIDYKKFARLPENFDNTIEMLPITREFVDNFKRGSRQWLSFFGISGCGKTTQACLAIEALTTRKQNPLRCRHYKTSTVISDLSALRFDIDKTRQYFDVMNRYEVIVLDDLLDCYGRPNYEEFLARVLKERSESRKSTIITCEGDLSKILEKFPDTGQSLIGRIVERSGKYLYTFPNAVNHRLDSLGL